ncbi:ribbon-helix-helix domain-containing protein [Spiribacter pallidus]|uniref:Ribbon-helix-helix domain-containing protein n=1 Tax=Spiribacter pallidus TaxID=1987936 RepID=A0ABV3TEU0_9GAMM
MSEVRDIRINARIDAAQAAQIDTICEREGINRTDLLRRAIDYYYQSLVLEKRAARDVLTSSGLIGCAEGPNDLASQDKRYLTEQLRRRHDGDR